MIRFINRKRIVFLALAALLSLTIIRCKKMEISQTETADGSENAALIKKFFISSQYTRPEIYAIVQEIKRQELERPFLKEFVTYAGYPNWEKSLILSGYTGGTATTFGKTGKMLPSKIIIIPFSLNNDTTLNAVLKATIMGKDTTFKMLYKWQYNQHGYEKHGMLNNADQTALFFMGYESVLFKHKAFRIKDTSLLRNKRSSDVITITSFNIGNSTGKMSRNSVEICFETACPEEIPTYYARPNSEIEIVPGYCISCSTYTYWYDDGQSSGGGASDGGPYGNNYGSTAGQEATGGGGTDGGSWSDDPCNRSGSTVHRLQSRLGCNNPPAWEPQVSSLDEGMYLPSEESIKYAIQNKPFAFFKDIPCEVIKAWLKTAKHTVPQPLIDRLNTIAWKSATISPGIGAPGFQDSHVANVQKLDDAYSTVVNMDYFPVTIRQLPVIDGVRQNPYQFLEYIRTHINEFVDTKYGEFFPFKWSDINDNALWYSDNPLGAIVNIDIKGPDNGSVIVSGFSSDKWTFTTVHEPIYGKHPVSGNRDFGFTYNADGSYTFYTRGVDRLTSWDVTFFQDYLGGIPFKSAENLWKSFQSRIKSFVNEKQGISSILAEQIYRPDYEQLKAVLEGRASLNSLNKDCLE